MIRNPALREACVNSLKRVAQKVLAVIAKYKDEQLPFLDELRVLTPDWSGMSQDLSSYKNLFDASNQQLLQRSGQWTIHWKLNIVAGADFDLLFWWENNRHFYWAFTGLYGNPLPLSEGGGVLLLPPPPTVGHNIAFLLPIMDAMVASYCQTKSDAFGCRAHCLCILQQLPSLPPTCPPLPSLCLPVGSPPAVGSPM